MTPSRQCLRAAFRVLSKPDNGYVIVQCESLDLLAQGKTEDEAQAQLADEIVLLLAAATEDGTLESWIAKASTPGGDGTRTLEIDLAGHS